MGTEEKLGYRGVGKEEGRKLRAEVKWGTRGRRERRGSRIRAIGNRKEVGSKGKIGDSGEQEQLIANRELEQKRNCGSRGKWG